MIVMRNYINKNLHTQSGGALIIMVFIILLAGTTALFSALNTNGVKVARDKKTANALAEAKAALIGWSAGHATMPGALPCPDTANTGSSGVCTATVGIIGRLPWKSLGLSDLRDGDGECLWYALSPLYRNTIATGSRGGANTINSTIPGTIMIKDAYGTSLPAPINPVIAVIIAPRAPLYGQSRSNLGSTVCGGNITSNNYLDATLGVNNSTGNVSSGNYTFIAGLASDTFNDRLIYITAEDLYSVVKKRIVTEVLGSSTIHAGPVKYYDTNASYPCPASIATGGSDCTFTSGFVNNSGMALQYATLGTWLAKNGWFALANYTYSSSARTKISITDDLGSYSCEANLNVFTCASP